MDRIAFLDLDEESQRKYLLECDEQLNGVPRLLLALNQAASVLANDIVIRNDGSQVGLIYLNGDKEDKSFDQLMKMFERAALIKGMALIIDDKAESPEPKVRNIQAMALNK